MLFLRSRYSEMVVDTVRWLGTPGHHRLPFLVPKLYSSRGQRHGQCLVFLHDQFETGLHNESRHCFVGKQVSEFQHKTRQRSVQSVSRSMLYVLW